MRPPYRLVPDTISGDTVRALEQLLYGARKGQLIGVAFVAMYKHKALHRECGWRGKTQPCVHARHGGVS